jgi:hypothetical protein
VPPAWDRTAAPPLARWDIEAEMGGGQQQELAMPARFGSFVSGAEVRPPSF